MTLDLDTLTGLGLIAGAVAAVVSGLKVPAALAWPELTTSPLWRWGLRALAASLAVAAVVAWIGVGPVQIAAGVIAGMLSETAYRWTVRGFEEIAAAAVEGVVARLRRR